MKKIYRYLCAAAGACIIFTGAYAYRSHRIQEDIAGKILRFHVIANSDSKEDQELKLKVRDEIGAYLSRELEEAGDLDTCEAIVNDHLAEIENCAREVIAKEGHTETVSAQITDAEFPVKTYGAYTFPKGTYRALKVVIGTVQVRTGGVSCIQISVLPTVCMRLAMKTPKRNCRQF